jgi:hypothetical protein
MVDATKDLPRTIGGQAYCLEGCDEIRCGQIR